MSDYYIKAVLLENCPFSSNALSLISSNKIPSEVIEVNHDNKNNYKSANISTFPQIYLNKKNSRGSLLLGGYDDLYKFISTFKNQPISEPNIQDFMKTYKWAKKPTLRLIELINLK